MDNYADYPKSITETRAKRVDKASEWTPRDALINALRDIDSGKLNPSHLVVMMATIDDDGVTHTDYNLAVPSLFYAVGMCHALSKELLA